MKYDHDYEYAFYANRPDYLNKGEKNAYRYKLTGCFNTGDYWVEVANNKDDIAWVMDKIYSNPTVVKSSIAMQNELGQLMWTDKFGFVEGIKHPKYMDEMGWFKVFSGDALANWPF